MSLPIWIAAAGGLSIISLLSTSIPESSSKRPSIILELTASRNDLSVGDSVLVSAVCRTDAPVFVLLSINFPGIHCFAPDPTFSLQEFRTRGGVFNKPHSKEWRGIVSPEKPIVVTGWFEATHCGRDTIRAASHFAMGGSRLSATGYKDEYVLTKVPICVQGPLPSDPDSSQIQAPSPIGYDSVVAPDGTVIKRPIFTLPPNEIELLPIKRGLDKNNPGLFPAKLPEKQRATEDGCCFRSEPIKSTDE